LVERAAYEEAEYLAIQRSAQEIIDNIARKQQHPEAS
jgi:hypothetical protein